MIKKRLFTLVELVIVVAILMILAISAFLVLVKWVWKSRDSRKLSDISMIDKSLKYYIVNDWKSKYPLPDESTKLDIKYWDTKWWYQWEFGDETKQKVKNLSKVPINPTTNKPYKYSVWRARKIYQIWTKLEQTESISLINWAYAIEDKIKLEWNHNGYVITITWTHQDGNIDTRIWSVPGLFLDKNDLEEWTQIVRQNWKQINSKYDIKSVQVNELSKVNWDWQKDFDKLIDVFWDESWDMKMNQKTVKKQIYNALWNIYKSLPLVVDENQILIEDIKCSEWLYKDKDWNCYEEPEICDTSTNEYYKWNCVVKCNSDQYRDMDTGNCITCPNWYYPWETKCLLSDPVAYWKFDDNLDDSSWNNNNWILNWSPAYKTWKFWKWMNFDWDVDYVSVPNSSTLKSSNFNNGWGLTISVWIRAESNHPDLSDNFDTFRKNRRNYYVNNNQAWINYDSTNKRMHSYINSAAWSTSIWMRTNYYFPWDYDFTFSYWNIGMNTTQYANHSIQYSDSEWNWWGGRTARNRTSFNTNSSADASGTRTQTSRRNYTSWIRMRLKRTWNLSTTYFDSSTSWWDYSRNLTHRWTNPVNLLYSLWSNWWPYWNNYLDNVVVSYVGDLIWSVISKWVYFGLYASPSKLVSSARTYVWWDYLTSWSWNHLIYTFDTASWEHKLYVNWQLIWVKTNAGWFSDDSATTTKNDINIGSLFKWDIDDAVIFNYALQEDDISKIYNEWVWKTITQLLKEQ